MNPELAILLLRFMEHALVERCQYDKSAMAAALLADVQAEMRSAQQPLTDTPQATAAAPNEDTRQAQEAMRQNRHAYVEGLGYSAAVSLTAKAAA